jgi:hypothetical protein
VAKASPEKARNVRFTNIIELFFEKVIECDKGIRSPVGSRINAISK